MAWTGIAQTLRNVVRLSDHEEKEHPAVISARFVRHLLVGGTSTAFYMIGLVLLVEFVGIHAVFSAMISFLCSTVFTYTLNHLWVYRSQLGHSRSVPRFLVVIAVAFTLNTLIMFLTVNILDWWYIWGLVFATAIVPPTNFLLNYYWAFE